MRKVKCLMLGMCVMLFSSGACFTQGVDLLRRVVLDDDVKVGTCFELEIGDNLIEIPCSVFE